MLLPDAVAGARAAPQARHPLPASLVIPPTSPPPMIELREKSTGNVIGIITEEQLRTLTDEMEEESATDRDYYVSRDTLEMFEEDGIDPSLVAMLRQALGGRQDIEIEWDAA